jgi:hypothetical protein
MYIAICRRSKKRHLIRCYSTLLVRFRDSEIVLDCLDSEASWVLLFILSLLSPLPALLVRYPVEFPLIYKLAKRLSTMPCVAWFSRTVTLSLALALSGIRIISDPTPLTYKSFNIWLLGSYTHHRLLVTHSIPTPQDWSPSNINPPSSKSKLITSQHFR